MKILHIGDSNVSFTRFIDMLNREELSELILLSTPSHSNLYLKIIKSCEGIADFEKNKHKLIYYNFNLSFTYRVIEKLFRISMRLSFLSLIIKYILVLFKGLINFILKHTNFNILDEINKKHSPDFIWIGSHNFDGSNLLTWLTRLKTNQKIVRSYKETNGVFTLDEKEAFKASDILIFPRESYLTHFKSIYRSINFDKKNVYYADEDWRYSDLINYILHEKIEKLSYKDSVPHVVILTGRATYGLNDSFTNSRYNYLPLIKKLIDSSVHVHLHCAFFYNSTLHYIDKSGNNPYYQLQKSSKYFHIERKLNLENTFDDYKILKKYDAGILHNYKASDKISSFSKINIPNRLYEYQICNVLPIVLNNTLLEVEKIIKELNFGLTGSNYEEVTASLKKIVVSKDKFILKKEQIKTYNDFVDILLNSFKC